MALGITPEQLRNPEVVHRLQDELKRGAALHQLDVLHDIERLRKGGDGSVNATLATLRQVLGWDRHDAAKHRATTRPDLEAGIAELDRILKRCREAR